MQPADPSQFLQEAELLFGAREVDLAIGNLAKEINRDYAHKLPVIFCVMSGGVYLAGQLLPKLSIPSMFDYMHATRYQGGVEGNSVNWLKKPSSSIAGKDVLILDDILDQGLTLKAIVDECNMLNAKQIKIAVLVEKDTGQAKPIQADYVGLTVPNRYVFGCGMDIYGWWRNLPAIYAWKNEVKT